MRLMSAIVLLLMSGCSSVHSDDANYKVLIHGNEECNYDYGVEDFCDEYNQISYKKTDKTINFDTDKVLVFPEDNFGYLVVINPETQIAYPFGYLVNYKKLSFSKDSNEFCIEGDISAYRDEDSGYFCFEFTEKNFERIYDATR